MSLSGQLGEFLVTLVRFALHDVELGWRLWPIFVIMGIGEGESASVSKALGGISQTGDVHL